MTDPTASAPPPGEPPVTDAELHAYADRQLTPERSAEVERWLAHRPHEAGRVRAWEAQTRELRALFDPVLREVVPPALHASASARRRGSAWPKAIAAGIAVALLAGGLGWTLRGSADRALLASASTPRPGSDSGRGNEFAARAAIAHAVYVPEVRRPVEVDAEHEDQLVTWLSKRLGAPMKVPHLQAVGYALEGGRLLPGERGPVAQFMYRDDAGRRLTLYVSNEARSAGTTADAGFRFAREGKVNVFYWVDGAFAYAISAEADRETLARVSAEVYRKLDAGKP